MPYVPHTAAHSPQSGPWSPALHQRKHYSMHVLRPMEAARQHCCEPNAVVVEAGVHLDNQSRCWGAPAPLRERWTSATGIMLRSAPHSLQVCGSNLSTTSLPSRRRATVDERQVSSHQRARALCVPCVSISSDRCREAGEGADAASHDSSPWQACRWSYLEPALAAFPLRGAASELFEVRREVTKRSPQRACKRAASIVMASESDKSKVSPCQK